MENSQLTYDQLLNDCIADVDRLYARLGALRDCAEEKEKDFCNYGRSVLGPLQDQLAKYSDMISANGRADMILGDWSGSCVYKPLHV